MTLEQMAEKYGVTTTAVVSAAKSRGFPGKRIINHNAAKNEWRAEAKNMLRQGFGVEDIAIHTGVEASHVRQFVSALRASGRLTDVLFGRRYRGEW